MRQQHCVQHEWFMIFGHTFEACATSSKQIEYFDVRETENVAAIILRKLFFILSTAIEQCFVYCYIERNRNITLSAIVRPMRKQMSNQMLYIISNYYFSKFPLQFCFYIQKYEIVFSSAMAPSHSPIAMCSLVYGHVSIMVLSNTVDVRCILTNLSSENA